MNADQAVSGEGGAGARAVDGGASALLLAGFAARPLAPLPLVAGAVPPPVVMRLRPRSVGAE